MKKKIQWDQIKIQENKNKYIHGLKYTKRSHIRKK